MRTIKKSRFEADGFVALCAAWGMVALSCRENAIHLNQQ